MLDDSPIISDWLRHNQKKALNTYDTAIKTLKKYDLYLRQRSISNTEYLTLCKQDETTQFRMVNDFIGSLDIAPSSMRQTWSFFKSFLRWNGIKITSEDRTDFIRFKPIEKINRKPLTREIIKDICKESSLYYRVLFLIQESSGNRISETLHLTKEDFDFTSTPVSAVIQAKNTKTKTERHCFISKEALLNLQKFGVNEFFESPKKLNAVEWYFWKIRNSLNLLERYPNNMYQVNIHAFRAYFRTMAVKANLQQDMAENLIGHTGYLKQYIRPELNDLKKAYTKLEPYLRIF